MSCLKCYSSEFHKKRTKNMTSFFLFLQKKQSLLSFVIITFLSLTEIIAGSSYIKTLYALVTEVDVKESVVAIYFLRCILQSSVNRTPREESSVSVSPTLISRSYSVTKPCYSSNIYLCVIKIISMLLHEVSGSFCQ